MHARLSLFVALVALGAGCPEPRQYEGPIPVNPDARQLRLMPGYGKDAGAPAAAAPAARPARVHAMKAGEELGGPQALGRPGDLLLENDEAAFVIERLGASSGFAESGGNLLDAADARVRKDELGQVMTAFGRGHRQAVYDALDSGVDANGTAWIEAKGHDSRERALAVTTRYALAPPDRALLVTTTVHNAGDRPLELAFGDAIAWGGAEPIAPGLGLGGSGASTGPYIGGIGRFTSYALTSTEFSIDAGTDGYESQTVQKGGVTLAPGASESYARVLVVGLRGDLASIVAELAHASAGELGGVELAVVDENGKPLAVPFGAKAVLATPAGADVLSIRASAAGGPLGGEVPPGEYVVRWVQGGGRAARGAPQRVTVKPNDVARATLAVGPAGELAAECDGASPGAAVPCKITIEGLGGTPDPDFGAAYLAGPAKNQITTATGRATVPLTPGRYRVTMSRGPEHALAQHDLEIAPGALATVQGTLARLVDTSGYVAADLHQHTLLGLDAPVTTRDRLVADAAEGVEVAVASEHNVVADLEPVVRDLGLASSLVALPGDELTSDANAAPWGHANAFPLAVDPAKPRGGAVAVREGTARDAFAAVRAGAAPLVVQIDHPRKPGSGYFDLLRFDRRTGTGADPGYDPSFDAVEVWNGLSAGGAVLDDFLALLRAGHPTTPTASSDTHGVVGQEPGYPRTYVRVANDGAFDQWDAARSADFVHGLRDLRDVVLTNGPFLRVTANGAPIGGVAKGHDVDVAIHVECAPWACPSHAQIWLTTTSGPIEELIGMHQVPGKPVTADKTVRLHFEKDAAFYVVANGGAPMTPVLRGDPKTISPWAMTGAIWVDADGDGHALGRSAP